MQLRRYVPQTLKDYRNLLRVQRRYPHAGNLQSAFIHSGAELGRGVSVDRDVIIGRAVRIGDWTYINRGCYLASGEVGRYCSVASSVTIGAEEHPLTHLSTSPLIYDSRSSRDSQGQHNELSAPPVIGSDVWIGTAAQIMQGVEIGHGAVVGAGAIVTRNVEPFMIVTGIPARPLRPRFSEQVRTDLLNLAWWEMSPEEIQVRYGGAIAAGSNWVAKLSR